MILTRLNEVLWIVNDSAQEVDVYCAYEDEERTTSGAGPMTVATGSAVLAVATATPTQVIPGDKPRGSIRKVMYLSLKAPIANSVSVTARLRLETNAGRSDAFLIDLLSVPLAPGDNRIYIFGVGWQFIPASGVPADSTTLVQQLITELRNQTANGDLV